MQHRPRLARAPPFRPAWHVFFLSLPPRSTLCAPSHNCGRACVAMQMHMHNQHAQSQTHTTRWCLQRLKRWCLQRLKHTNECSATQHPKWSHHPLEHPAAQAHIKCRFFGATPPAVAGFSPHQGLIIARGHCLPCSVASCFPTQQQPLDTLHTHSHTQHARGTWVVVVATTPATTGAVKESPCCCCYWATHTAIHTRLVLLH